MLLYLARDLEIEKEEVKHMYNAVLNKLNLMRIQVIHWWKEEKGASAIIATILILVVVVALGVMFQNEIQDLAESIWQTITDSASKGGFASQKSN